MGGNIHFGGQYAIGQMAEGLSTDQAAYRGQRGLRRRAGHRQRQAGETSYDVKPGDILELKFGEKLIRVEVLSTAEIVGKAGAEAMYQQL